MYQAPNTLGWALVNGEERFKILGQVYQRRADVVQIGGLPGHAGQRMLVEKDGAVKGRAPEVFLVYREERPAEALHEKLMEAGVEKMYYPYLRQTMVAE